MTILIILLGSSSASRTWSIVALASPDLSAGRSCGGDGKDGRLVLLGGASFDAIRGNAYL